MTNAKFFINAEGKYVGFHVEGHSNYAPIGQDIVCCGVSTACQMAIAGIQVVLKAKAVISIVPETASMFMALIEPDKIIGDQAESMIAAAKVVVMSIHEQYPDHVSLEIVRADQA